jgi:hypothetical protein
MATARHTINVTAEAYTEDSLTRQLLRSLVNELDRFPGCKVSRLTVLPMVVTRSYGWKKQKARLTIVVESAEVKSGG